MISHLIIQSTQNGRVGDDPFVTEQNYFRKTLNTLITKDVIPMRDGIKSFMVLMNLIDGTFMIRKFHIFVDLHNGNRV